MGWQPDTQPKGKPLVEKTKGAETMQRLIYANAVIAPLKEEYKKIKQAFDETSVFKAPNDVALYGALMQEVGAVIGMIEDAKTIDAVPLDGSFLKMSNGDYLIYNRHWLYEHFDMEMEIQRSAMKSMGYEPAIKDAQPRWIPFSERLPEVRQWVLCQCRAGIMDVLRLTEDGSWYKGYPNAEYMGGFVVAWMPLPKPYEGDKE
jgi:hypothetical protein